MSKYLKWCASKHSAKIIIIAPNFKRVEFLAKRVEEMTDTLSGIKALTLGSRKKKFLRSQRKERDHLLNEKNDVVVTVSQPYSTLR